MAKYGIGGKKGGPGKSTVAVTLAVQLAQLGRDVLLVDCDPQRSAMMWAAIRSGEKVTPAITCVSAYGDTVNAEINRLADKFDDVVIDTAGHDSVELRSTLLTADVLITPVEVSMFDVSTLSFMCDIIRTARIYNPALKSFLLPNKITTHATRGAIHLLRLAEAAEKLPEYTLMKHSLKSRAAYADAIESGKVVVETKDKQAATEMRHVFEEVFNG